MDSLIILLSQQNGTYFVAKNLEVISSFGDFSHSNISWRQFIPENIRIAPFPTREYTDDEFQSIVKTVMGVL